MLDASKVNAPAELICLETTASTQDDAAERAADAADFTAIYADEMSAGRGRRDNQWQMFPGCSLAVSIILDPTPMQLPLVVALTVQQTLQRETGLEIQLKWPNDLLIDGKKIAGILVEPAGGGSDRLILGIGLNVNTPAEGLAEDFIGTTLEAAAGKTFSREDLLSHILQDCERKIKTLRSEGWSAFAPDYAAHCITLDQRVTWRPWIGQPVTGTAVGLSAEGALVIDADNGQRVTVGSGDIIAPESA